MPDDERVVEYKRRIPLKHGGADDYVGGQQSARELGKNIRKTASFANGASNFGQLFFLPPWPSLSFGLAVGCLLHCWRASNGLLCSTHPFRATLGRCFIPGLDVSERLSAMCPIDLETVPILCQPGIRVWLVLDDDNSIHLQLSCP